MWRSEECYMKFHVVDLVRRVVERRCDRDVGELERCSDNDRVEFLIM